MRNRTLEALEAAREKWDMLMDEARENIDEIDAEIVQIDGNTDYQEDDWEDEDEGEWEYYWEYYWDYPEENVKENVALEEFYAGQALQGLLANPERYKYISELVNSGQITQEEASLKNARKAFLIAKSMMDVQEGNSLTKQEVISDKMEREIILSFLEWALDMITRLEGGELTFEYGKEGALFQQAKGIASCERQKLDEENGS